MFTGIIEERGVIRLFRERHEGASLTVGAEKIPSTLKQGDSISVNGVCLTTVQSEAGFFSCDLSAETLQRTSLGQSREGKHVNLERPLSVGDRLGGHFVLGHVDGVGRLASKTRSGDGCVMAFQFPQELARYLVFKGSIALDGVSLTIASLQEKCFTVAVIPHTLQVTNLSELRPGDPVNLEVDILGKYFERFLQLGLIDEKVPQMKLECFEEQGS